MLLYMEDGCAAMIKLRILTWEFILDYPGGPQMHPIKSFMREAEGDLGEKGNVSMGPETGAMQPQSEERRRAARSCKKKRTESSLRASEGNAVLPTPQFQTAGLQNCERTHWHCFKPPRLWSFSQEP